MTEQMSPSSSSINSTTQNLKHVRTTITPYLPPPIIKLISCTDEYLKAYTDEGSMTILFTVVLAYIVYSLGNTIKRIVQSRISVLHDDDDDVMGLVHKKSVPDTVTVSSTIVLCGVSGSGKTVLFHKLAAAANESIVTTVPSLKAAEAFVNDNNERTIRLIDYPGHASLRSSLPLSYPDKLLFLIDSSKSITESAQFLFHILTHKVTTNKQKELMVVCNKADLPLAKNLKRIKLQLRTELERLRKVKMTTLDNSNEKEDEILVPKTSFDLDTSDGLQYKLSFVESSSIGSNQYHGFLEIRNFIFN